MRKFLPIPNVRLTCANSDKQAEQIVNFLNSHYSDLGVSFHIENGCVICADCIKQSRIDYILGVIAGFLLSK